MPPRVASAEVKDAVKDVKEKDDLTKIDVVATTHDALYDLISELNEEVDALKTKNVAFKGQLTEKIKNVADARGADTVEQKRLVNENLARLKRRLDMPAPVAPPPGPPVAPPVAPPPGPSGSGTFDQIKDFAMNNKLAVGLGLGAAALLTFIAVTGAKAGKTAQRAGLFLGLSVATVAAALGIKWGIDKAKEFKDEIDKLKKGIEDFKKLTTDKLNDLESKGGEKVEEIRYELAERALDGLKADLPGIAKNTNAFARRRDLDAKNEALNKAVQKMNPANQEKFLKEKGIDPGPLVVAPFKLKKIAGNKVEVEDATEALMKEPLGATAVNLPVIHADILRATKADAGAVADLIQDPAVQAIDVADLLILAAVPNEAAAFANPLMAPYAGNEAGQRALWFIAKAVKEQMDKNIYKGRKDAGVDFDPAAKNLGELLAVGGQGIRVIGRIRSAFNAKPGADAKGTQEIFKQAFDPSALETDAKSAGVKDAIKKLDPAKLGGKETAFAAFCISKSGSLISTVVVPATLPVDEQDAYKAGITELQSFVTGGLDVALMKYVTTPEQKTALTDALKELTVADALQLYIAAQEIVISDPDGDTDFLGKPAKDQALGRIQIRSKIAELMSRKNPAAAKAYFESISL